MIDPHDRAALNSLVRMAVLTKRGADALAWVKSLTDRQPQEGVASTSVSHAPASGGGHPFLGLPNSRTPEVMVAISKLMASTGSVADALAIARDAAGMTPVSAVALEQLASLLADAGDLAELNATVARLLAAAPQAPAGYYYAGAAAFIRGDVEGAVRRCRQAIALDADYAPVYDLLGAAHTKLQHPDEARAAFEQSLAFDAHDSTAYTNQGVLELGLGRKQQAARYFAEALWLTPDSPVARQGLAESRR